MARRTTYLPFLNAEVRAQFSDFIIGYELSRPIWYDCNNVALPWYDHYLSLCYCARHLPLGVLYDSMFDRDESRNTAAPWQITAHYSGYPKTILPLTTQQSEGGKEASDGILSFGLLLMV